jgi:hypothetical protein
MTVTAKTRLMRDCNPPKIMAVKPGLCAKKNHQFKGYGTKLLSATAVEAIDRIGAAKPAIILVFL